jgi:hypothetical protein
MPVHDWTRVDAGIFHAFHHNWITTLSGALNEGLLPPDYYALPEQIAGGPVPDVFTLKRPNRAGRGPVAGVALDVEPPNVKIRLRAEAGVFARKADRVAVRHVSGHDTVAVIETISPGNKGSLKAVRTFVKKAVALLNAGVHLLVVDLFPPTRQDPAGLHSEIWGEVGGGDVTPPGDRPPCCVAYRAVDPPEAFVEPVTVAGALPAMPLFLTDDVYVRIPFESCYRDAWNLIPAYWCGVIAG